jgi:hypothetical protein
MIETLWKLPFPSSWAWDSRFQELPRRECAVVFPNELDEGRTNHLGIVFAGVQAYKCTYLHAITPVREAYDTLIDLGKTDWLDSIKNRMATHGDDTSDLHHLMITFDDGPSYEFICKSFRVEKPAETSAEHEELIKYPDR